jgi:hypothetical protein
VSGLKTGCLLVLGALSLGANLAGIAAPIDPCGFAPNRDALHLSYVDISAGAKAFQCAPFPIGTGTAPTLRSNQFGSVAWWYCPSEKGEFHVNWGAATSETLSAAHFFEQAGEVLHAPNPSAAFAAATGKNVTLPLNDPRLTPIWCPFFNEMVRATPPARVATAGVAASDSSATK